MSTDSLTSDLERFRHWITEVEISPLDTDPNCKFSARIFVDNELVCNLPWIDHTRSLRWSGLLLCEVSAPSKVSLRLCRSVNDKLRYFNFPPLVISELDETGESTLELPEAAWVVTLKSLDSASAERLFPGELDKFNAVEEAYGGAESNESAKNLFKNVLRFAAIALPESTAKVSFLVYLKAWEILHRETQLDDPILSILHSLTRICDIVDVASQASSSMLATAMYGSREPIRGILTLLEDVSVYILNRYTTNYLARILQDEAEPNEVFDIEGYLDRLEDLQKAFYASWSPTGISRPDSNYTVDSEVSERSRHSLRVKSDEPTRTDWHEIQNLLRPINPTGYDLDRACLKGTREVVLNKILTWTQNRENSENFMWISGQAGMGKSSIAASLCQRLDSIRALAGSFFCRRDDPGSVDPLNIINNLVCEMSMNCPTYAHEVANAIRANPKLCNAQLSLRYQGLVKRPLKQLKFMSMPVTMVVVVDGLDECGDHDTRTRVLLKLYEMSRLVPWLKVIFTGRPVADLESQFRTNCSQGAVVHMQDYDASSDIRAYVEGELGKLARTERWPHDSIHRLCTMAQGVFLWAKLAVKYIKKSTFPSMSRLQKVLNNQRSPVTDHFDALYATVLKEAIEDNEDETKEAYLQCIGSILVTSGLDSPNEPDLQYLLLLAGQSDQLTFDHIMKNLAPLLLVRDGRRIRFYHTSFKDFVSDPSRSAGVHIQLDQCEAHPAARCLTLMQRDLRFNICELETSHRLNSEVPDLKLRIQSHIGSTLEYACLNWVDHFISSPNQALVETVTEFLEGPRLMYWVEVLSLLGRLDVAIEGLSKLTSFKLNRFDGWSLIVPWVKDARRFLLSFYDAISASTPHLYVSALAFAPSKSPTAHRMRAYFPNTIAIAKDPGLSWHPCVQTITHPQAVQSLSVSPDGLRIVVGYPDGSLAMWDVETGIRICEAVMGHEDSVSCITYSPGGDLIASGSYDTTIRVWREADQLRSSYVLAGHSGVICAVAFSPNSSVIASGSSDNTIWLWDTRTMCALHGPYSGHSSSVSSLAFSPDGSKLVSGSWDKTILVWTVAPGGQQLMGSPLVITGHTNSVNCVAFSPDGSTIASGSADRTIQLWDSETGGHLESSASSATLSDRVTSIAFSSNGALLVSSSADGRIQVRNPSTLEEVVSPFGHSHAVNALAFSPNGAHVVSGSADYTTRVWEIIPILKPMTMAPITGHSSPVYCVAISSDGKRIASGSGDHTVRMWDAQTGSAVGNPYVGHSSFVYALAFVYSDTRIVSASIDMTLKLWDIAKNSLVRSYQHNSRIRCIATSPDGSLIAFGSDDEQVYLWDPKRWKMVNGPLEAHSGLIWSLAFSPDGSYLASASGNTVILWDIRTHSRTGKQITGHTQPIRSVVFSPCGTQLITGSDDGTVRVWDVKTGNSVLEISGHSSQVAAVAVSPDGSSIASCSSDNTIRLWNSKTGQMIGEPLVGHSKRLRCITFSTDGNHLVSGSDDNSIRVWSIDSYFRQANDTQEALCWPTNPHGLSPHSDRPGWVTHDQQALAFWLPPHYQQPGQFGTRRQVPTSHTKIFLDYSRFVHGTDWTAVASDPVDRSSGLCRKVTSCSTDSVVRLAYIAESTCC